ncbi:hypothetical protein AWB92_27480 [Mycobacterium sp. IEC1808]|uniref:hypothetical protein n=1 Tax=Mycobacterium sp. IEC1808 TaxID=1743230 RepID=UPI000A150F3C|nr:hypothetical protein [Mycobacterium sp. IEC1808]ORW85236.1 hypothetical protein AWB92_27480 [Mycobacterium sp. IEC1808]
MEAAQLTGQAIHGPWLEGGTGWRDLATGCWVSAATPQAEPGLWEQYLDGAVRSYRRHGLEWVLDLDAIRDGTDTTLFFAVVDPNGRVVGGHRLVGPLRAPEQSHALDEWAGNPGRAVLSHMIANRIPFGVVEVKSAWTNSQDYSSRVLSRVLARNALPVMTMLDVQFIMATAAAHVLEQWASSGGVVASGIPAAAYPTEDYRTKVMWWDRRTIATHAEPEQFKLMCAHNAEILGRISA